MSKRDKVAIAFARRLARLKVDYTALPKLSTFDLEDEQQTADIQKDRCSVCHRVDCICVW